MLWSRRVVYSHTTVMLRLADLSGNDCMLNDLSLCFQFDSILYYVPKFCMIINDSVVPKILHRYCRWGVVYQALIAFVFHDRPHIRL